MPTITLDESMKKKKQPKPSARYFRDYFDYMNDPRFEGEKWEWIMGGQILKDKMAEGTAERGKITRALAEAGYTIVYNDTFFGIYRKVPKETTSENEKPTAAFKKATPKSLTQVLEETK